MSRRWLTGHHRRSGNDVNNQIGGSGACLGVVAWDGSPDAVVVILILGLLQEIDVVRLVVLQSLETMNEAEPGEGIVQRKTPFVIGIAEGGSRRGEFLFYDEGSFGCFFNKGQTIAQGGKDRLDAAVKSLKSSLDNLSRRVDELPRKVSVAMPRAAPAYSAPAGRAGAAVASQNPPVPARRTGTTDFSQVPTELEGEIEEPELEVDPSAVDPSAVDPSAVDPSAVETEAEVGVPPQPGFEPTEDPASLQGE